MSFHQINDQCFYYHSSVNIGYVTEGESGILIDAGIDRSSVKKVLKELHKRKLPLTHLYISHAHADHYGGAAYVQENYDVHTFAPAFEEAILRNPSLEPLYLFGGNDPLPELQNKFLQGPAVRIDEVAKEGKLQIGDIEAETYQLPGHSYQQLALKVNGILYAADAYFSVDTLRKHRIPYVTDAAMTLESLKQLINIPCDGALPGHGEYETDPSGTIQQNINYHQKLLDWLYDYIKEAEGASHEEVLKDMCGHYEVQAPQLSQWLLYRTAVTAYLVGLKKAALIEDRIVENRWMFYPSHADNE